MDLGVHGTIVAADCSEESAVALTGAVPTQQRLDDGFGQGDWVGLRLFRRRDLHDSRIS